MARTKTKEREEVVAHEPGTETGIELRTFPSLEHIVEPLRALAVGVEELHEDPANARVHPDRNLDAVKASLARFGQRKPIVVRAQGMIVEAGNGTLRAAKALGWTHVAVVVVDDDGVTAAGYAIADNRTAELADWDQTRRARASSRTPAPPPAGSARRPCLPATWRRVAFGVRPRAARSPVPPLRAQPAQRPAPARRDPEPLVAPLLEPTRRSRPRTTDGRSPSSCASTRSGATGADSRGSTAARRATRNASQAWSSARCCAYQTARSAPSSAVTRLPSGVERAGIDCVGSRT